MSKVRFNFLIDCLRFDEKTYAYVKFMYYGITPLFQGYHRFRFAVMTNYRFFFYQIKISNQISLNVFDGDSKSVRKTISI